MSLPILPTPSNFLGVALVINRTRDGPGFVFHYPPHIQPAYDRYRDYGDEGNEEDDVLLERSARPSALGATNGSTSNPSLLLQKNPDEHLVTDSGTQIVPWEHVAGFPINELASILTPARAYHKTLFQVSLDPLICVSYPIYAPENGVWKKKGKKKKKKPKPSKKGDEEVAPDAEPHEEVPAPTEEDHVEIKDMASKAAATEEAEDKISSMTMFNLVFILNPKKHEAKEVVDMMYSNIVRKVNKAYKYVQQRSDFVWKESKRILTLKDKAREDKRKMSLLWEEILQTSSLAASMQDLYDAISRNKIAALQLDTAEGTVTHSVQIPVPFHVPDLLPGREDDFRGLWITTANSVAADDGFEESGYLERNFALLLMDDERKIISELQADPDETTLAMIEFVRHSKPTMSFHQVGQQSSNILTVSQVRKYAQHFIFWRRAIAIPPLHARDIYILSPNADMRQLAGASAIWGKQFPFAPPLPNFLADLSAAPRPYKTFSPGKSYRPAYLTMLAWLMRGGWVTQLCTFAYVVVWPEIIYEVDYEMEAAEVAKMRESKDEAAEKLGHSPPGKGDSSENLASSTATILPAGSSTSAGLGLGIGTLHTSDEETQSSPISQISSSSPSSSFKSAPDSNDSNSQQHEHHHHHQPPPTAAEQAAEKARLERIADKAARELADKATAHNRKVPPKQTAHPSVNDASHLAHISPHIILDPKKATGHESTYLRKIGERLRQQRAKPPTSSKKDSGTERKDAATTVREWDERVATAWPLFWKYFNGRSALERIALQEEMKRKDVWNLLTAMSEYLICVRHW